MSSRAVMSADVYYASGIARAEVSMSRKQISGVYPLTSFNNRDNFQTNQVSMASYRDDYEVGVNAVMALSSAWACVNLIAGTIASLPLMVYDTAENGARTPARRNPLYRLLHDSPNADQTAVDFWEFICASVELRGNAFAEIERGARGQVVSLLPISPDIVRVKRDGNGDLAYSWSVDGQERRATQAQIFHVRGFGGNPIGGMSTISACRNTFRTAASIEHAASGTFANGVSTNIAFMSEKQLTKEQMDLATQIVQEKYQGAINRNRPLILNSDMKVQQLSINPEDAQMLESRRFSVEEICRIFGVPPHMVGHTESSTSWGTGLEQQTLGFQKFTLRRRLKRIEQAIIKQLLTDEDRANGVTVEFNLEGLLRADSAARASFNQTMLQNGVYTINEVRAQDNLPPVAGGDVPRMQMQNIPITQTPEGPDALGDAA